MALTDGEFRAGWRSLLTAFVGMGFGLPVISSFTLGIFAPHLGKAFGWRFSDIMAGIPIMTLTLLVAGPLSGVLAERVGVRPVVIGSLLLFGPAFMAFGAADGSLALYFATWAVMAFLGAGTLSTMWTRAINPFFDRHKGLALGIAATGGGLASALIKPLTSALIDAVGWRLAYVCIGLLPILVAVPVTVAFFPKDRTFARPGVAGGALDGMSMGEVMRDRRAAILLFALPVACFILTGIILNVENIVRVAGASKTDVVRIASMVGIASLVGRLGGGWLIDRIWAPLAGCLIFSAPALGCVILAQDQVAVLPAMLAVTLVGLALGVEGDLLGYFVARYFGMRHYTLIYAILFALYLAGGGLGALAFGRYFDRHGSYHGLLLGAGAMLVVVGLSLLALGRYRFGRRRGGRGVAPLAGATPGRPPAG